jgi:hypothetical protein
MAFLEKQLFVEGADVKKGDVLYTLERPPFQAGSITQRPRSLKLKLSPKTRRSSSVVSRGF